MSEPTAIARGRRASRTRGDDRQRAILDTAEQLLGQRTYADVSVDDLARGAGLSRPTFYFYFPSKESVLLALLDRVVAEARARRDEVVDHPAADTEGRWRQVIGAIAQPFRSHLAVTLAAAEARATSAAVRDVWNAVMDRFVTETAHQIEAERAAGTAPDGPPARDLAIALNWMNERVLHAAFAGEQPALAAEEAVEVLLVVWMRTIYATAPDPEATESGA